MAKVSICIPAYKNIDYLTRLLDSVFIQQNVDFEVVITDNTPDDSVLRIVEGYPKEKIRYKKNKGNIGPVANWNEALKLATGKYVKLMFQDDWFADSCSLEKFVSLLDMDQAACFAFSGTVQVESSNRYERAITQESLDLILADPKNIFLGNKIGAPSATIFRKNDILFDAKLKWMVDIDYYIRVFQENPRFAYSFEPLVCIGVSKTQMTTSCINDMQLNVFEYTYIYKKYNFESRGNCRKYYLRFLIESGSSLAAVLRLNLSVKDFSFFFFNHSFPGFVSLLNRVSIYLKSFFDSNFFNR